MRSNNVLEPVPIFQAAEVQAISLRKLTVSAEAQAAQKVTMVMLHVIERSFGQHKAKFGDWNNLLKSIRTAMQGRYLSSIEIFGFSSGSRVLSLKISIDWRTMSVLAEGADFKPLNPAIPPLAQVDEAISVIVSLLRNEVSNRRIESFKAMFSILASNDEEDARMSKECGLSNLTENDLEDLRRFRATAIGHAVWSDDVPGAVFRFLYVDTPIEVSKPSFLDRVKGYFI